MGALNLHGHMEFEWMHYKIWVDAENLHGHMDTMLCLDFPLIDTLANIFWISLVSLLISAHIKKLSVSLMQDYFGYLADPGKARGCSKNTPVIYRLSQ